jgi:hypothetical protein
VLAILPRDAKARHAPAENSQGAAIVRPGPLPPDRPLVKAVSRLWQEKAPGSDQQT